jgi:hypothetical protein
MKGKFISEASGVEGLLLNSTIINQLHREGDDFLVLATTMFRHHVPTELDKFNDGKKLSREVRIAYEKNCSRCAPSTQPKITSPSLLILYVKPHQRMDLPNDHSLLAEVCHACIHAESVEILYEGRY